MFWWSGKANYLPGCLCDYTASMLHMSRARTCLFTELEVNRVQAEPSVSLTRLGLTIWSQLQTFENTVKKFLMKGGRQKQVRRENKKKVLKRWVAIIKLTAAKTVTEQVICSQNNQWDQCYLIYIWGFSKSIRERQKKPYTICSLGTIVPSM